ncbi:MAG: hypothetical protein KGO05_10215 [Chloroflexota bacterium]|nr:hypothetical protein [Chloroflexota bacterium]
MAKGLYRVYLYVVTIALLVAGTVAVSILLGVLLNLTRLRGQYGSSPDSAAITQTVVLAVVTLIIVAGLGGLHYWLIRRDMASDPQPGESGVRSFTLNVAEAIATMVAVISGAFTLSSFSLDFRNELSYSLATALGAGGLTLLLEWERLRATPSRGAAAVFQRLRIDGLGFILAFTLVFFIGEAVHQTEMLIGQGSGALQCMVSQVDNPFYSGPYYPPCITSQLIGQWAASLLVIGVWLLYLRLGARDRGTMIRSVFLLLGYAAGVIALVYGGQRLVEYLLRLFTSTADARPDYINAFDAAPALVYAAVLLGVYGWRLIAGAQHEPLDLPTTRLTMRAVAGLIFAFPFWIGAQMILNNLFIRGFPGGPTTDTNWHVAFAMIIAGLAYVPLALWLGATTRAEGIKGPRRGFVLALLAAGALATAGSLATLLYSVVTALLRVPVGDWQSIARNAGATLIVGLILGGLYLWISLREGQFTRAPRPAPAPAPEGAPVPALDDVLARFQQGGLSQAEAAERIRALAREGALI